VFCATHAAWVDYKDVNTLRRLISDRGKIKARRVTGTCRQHQREAAIAIKTARELALLPYVVMTTTVERRGPRSGRDGPMEGQRSSRGPHEAGGGNGEEPANDLTDDDIDSADAAEHNESPDLE
jgi:small subunit ribosomal protein S18